MQSKIFADNNLNFDDYGIISIMYHRFNENKYPSTNIQMEVFLKHLDIIEQMNIKFVDPEILGKNFRKIKRRENFIYCG